MVIINCIGGLGNQMTQYAFYKELQFRGYEVKFDIDDFEHYKLHNYELDRVFTLKIDYANNLERSRYLNKFNKFLNKIGIKHNIIRQEVYYFSDEYVNPPKDAYMIGYWQSEKYFNNVINSIRADFVFSELTQENKLLANKIAKSNSVSMHIRRGDYVGNPLYENICTIDYYNRAFQFLKNKVDNLQVFIFSNDLEWCQKNLKFNNCIYVIGNVGNRSHIDMHLMSLCKYNILANSSFSWWAGWLNKNKEKIVIVPQKFFNENKYDERDLYPEEWIKL